MTRSRVLIIGIDSGTWKCFNPFIDKGVMPHLKNLRDKGTYGQLESTCPALTPPGWTTLMTGVQPGKHHILGFQKYDPDKNTMEYNTSHDIAVETMWNYLSKLGYTVASLNMPMTYPPLEVNGAMVSGFGCPGTDCEFTWPRTLKKDILESIPTFSSMIDWEGGDDLSQENAFNDAVDKSIECFKNEQKLYDLVTKQYNWDALLIQIHQLDFFLHFGWGATQTDFLEKYPDRGEKMKQMFACLDDFIGHMVSSIDQSNDVVAVVSDHGHGPAKKRFKPNTLLRDWGYLTEKKGWDYIQFRMKKNITNLFSKKHQRRMNAAKSFDQEIKFSASKTKAFVTQADQSAKLIINLKGRQPNGIVEPGADYDAVVDDLKKKFSEATDPKTGEKLLSNVDTPENIYGVKKEERATFGDLVLVPNKGVWLRNRIHKNAIDYISGDLKGTHDKQGMYLFYGPNISTGQMDANIADIVPTVYAILGVPIYTDLDGRVLNEIFQEKPEPTYQGTIPDKNSMGQTVLSSDEEDALKDKLVNLGYL